MIGLYRSLGFETDELAVLAALTVGDKEELSDDYLWRPTPFREPAMYWHFRGLHIGFSVCFALVCASSFVEAMAAVETFCCFCFWSFSW